MAYTNAAHGEHFEWVENRELWKWKKKYIWSKLGNVQLFSAYISHYVGGHKQSEKSYFIIYL